MAPIPADRNFAAVIRTFERLGWATSVHWPARARLESRRRDQGQHQPAPVLQTAGLPAGIDLTVNSVHCNVNNVARN
jgi:hypothetical protein